MKYVLLTLISFAGTLPAVAQVAADLGRAEWYRPPRLTVMMGFIKDPQHQRFSVKQWSEGIGEKFDAAAITARMKRAGVTQVIWYDKWIDGLVFRKTKTTTYVTARDFLGELAPECRKQGIKLVIYFNTFYDGNPEFAQWAAVDQRGNPITFSRFWPENLLSIFSPFRAKALEQIRELVADYGVDGLYLDVPGYALISYDQWTREAFRKTVGKDVDDAGLVDRRRFAIQSAVQWNQEVAEFVHRLNPKVTVATNELIDPVVEGPARSMAMSRVVDYFTTELHTTDLQVNRGPTLGGALKPYEIVTLISDDWFTPLRSGPVKTSKSADQMHVELASIFSAGLNTCLAITFAHDGSLEENTLKLVDLAGDWLKQRRQWLAGATDYNDVGILLGSPAEDVLDWPGGGLFGGTRVNAGSGNSYDTELLNLERSLRRAGYLPTRLIEAPPNRSYAAIPKGMRTIIVPDRAQLMPRDREMVEAFVRAGGVVLGLGRGGMLSRTAGEEAGQPAALFGVRGGGYGAVNYQVLAAAKETALTGAALHTHPDSAETLIWAYESRVGSFPFLTSNAIGAGKAFLAAASEASLGPQAPLLQELWKAVIGQPSYRLMDHPERYTVRLRRASGKSILHVIDTPDAQEGPMNRYRPLYTRLALNAKTCAFTRATTVPDGRSVEVRREGDWLVMELFPDPELTIVLE